MTLNSVLCKVKSGITVTLFDYLSDEVYANIEVEKILENSFYQKKYKNAKVYGIDVGQPCFGVVVLEIRIVLEKGQSYETSHQLSAHLHKES